MSLANSDANSLANQQLNQQLKNQLHQQLATIVGGVTAQLSGEKAQVGMNIAGTADQFNRQMHYDDFIEKLTACHNQNSSDCQQLQHMAGVRNEFVEEVPELPESSVVINYNEDNEVVSYTVVNKSQGNRPVLIFEPKEFEAYKAGSLSNRGLYLLSPQWSFDIGSAALYAGEEKSLDYIVDAVTSPEYIFTAITSTMGTSAYLGRSSVVAVPKERGLTKNTDKRVFWSGPDSREVAENYAKANDAKTLEMTILGKILDKVTTTNNFKYMKSLWNAASNNFAKNAKGSVDVFHSNKGVRIESVWAKKEYPLLKNQGNKINYHLVE